MCLPWEAVAPSFTITAAPGAAWQAARPIYLRASGAAPAVMCLPWENSGIILHYDGSAWSIMASGTARPLYNIWGRSSTDVFAVGGKGTILHYDGSYWSSMPSGTNHDILGIWGSSGSDVFAVGWTNSEVILPPYYSILHYNGSFWEIMKSGIGLCHSVWGISGSDVFAAGGENLRYDGSTWSSIGDGIFLGVWAYSVNDVFFVGDYGKIKHYGGSPTTTTAALTTTSSVPPTVIELSSFTASAVQQSGNSQMGHRI